MRRNRQTGSALIEFAMSLILLSALFTGIFQVGYTYYGYQRLVNSVRAGARYASLRPGAVTDAGFAEAVRNLVVYSDPVPAENSKAILAGLTPENVDVVVQDKIATVSIHGFVLDSLFSKVRLDGRPTVTFPRGVQPMGVQPRGVQQ
jgi:Flp pilus assembly protein TadG